MNRRPGSSSSRTPSACSASSSEGILTLFFHDLDFTIPPEELASSLVKEHLGVKESALYAAAGLPPHPSELAFEEVMEPDWMPSEEDEDSVWRPGSTMYPDPIDA